MGVQRCKLLVRVRPRRVHASRFLRMLRIRTAAIDQPATLYHNCKRKVGVERRGDGEERWRIVPDLCAQQLVNIFRAVYDHVADVLVGACLQRLPRKCLQFLLEHVEGAIFVKKNVCFT